MVSTFSKSHCCPKEETSRNSIGDITRNFGYEAEGLMIIRGREYSDIDEYLDEKQQYRLDELKRGKTEQDENGKEEEDGK